MRHHHKHNRNFHFEMPEDCCSEDDFRSDMPRMMRKMMLMRGIPGMSGHPPFMGRGKSHGHGMRRHFISKTEKIEHLEKYKDQLQKELAGLEEHITEFKQTKDE